MIDFKLPSLGADMDEGALVAWLVEPGDTIERGQIVAEVETDKGIIEVECWEDAVVVELLVEPSEVRLAVGTLIARFRSRAEEPVIDGGTEPAESAGRVPAEPEIADLPDPEPVVTPPVRHLAHELGVALADVSATGGNGKVTRDDIRRTAASRTMVAQRPKVSPRARRIAADRGLDLTAVEASREDGLVVAEDLAAGATAERAPRTPVEPFAGAPVDKALAMRRAIAKQMERSKREIPHYYLSDEIDLERMLSWLEAVNDDRPITARILPAVPLLKAAATALTRVPGLNGHYTEDGFVPSEAVHLGVAVSLRGGGLVAPAIHDAARRSLSEMMEALSDLVARARAGRLRGSEMTDPTSTVTNLGDRGVAATFPVIIPPQVSIIGFGRIVDRPVAVDGDLAIHPVVTVSLAADHRVTDGHTGGLLLHAIDQLLQEPENL